jgi:DNA-directed RNA polymerase specialized sigma subunit
MNKKQIAALLRDYFWMVNEIARQRGMLEDAGENLTAQYGIEASMPKAQGGNSDPVYIEVQRRVKKTTRIEKLEKKVSFLQGRIHLIDNEREKTVLDCLLDGMSMIKISRHMGLSERHVYILRDKIVDQMAGADFAGNAGFTGKMTSVGG